MSRRRRTESRRARRLASLATLAAATIQLGACYTLTPVPYESLAPHQTVRAVLAPSGGQEMAEVLGHSATVVEGELVEMTAQGIYLLVPSTVREPGFRLETLHQRLLVPRGDIAHVERKQLDRTRTGLLIGAGGVALAAVVVELFAGGFGGSDPPGEDGPADLRVPLLRLPIR